MTRIITFLDFKKSYSTLKDFVPNIAYNDLQELILFGWYDGPLEGVVDYKGQKCWYQVVSDYIMQSMRYYVLIHLTAEEYLRELYRHQKFQEQVKLGFTKECELESRIYRKQQQNAFRNKEVVAWFSIP